MSRPVKCQFCGDKFTREDGNFEKVSKGYYHKECYKKEQKEKELSQGLREYINTLFQNRVNHGLINKQIANFKNQYNYTESGIMGTLYYCYDIKKMPIAKANGIGVVPYYYNEAKNYFKVKEQAEGQVIKITDKTVLIDEPKNNKRKNFIVDLESIISEVE